jgi:hypothetical protein
MDEGYRFFVEIQGFFEKILGKFENFLMRTEISERRPPVPGGSEPGGVICHS